MSKIGIIGKMIYFSYAIIEFLTNVFVKYIDF